MTSIYLSFYPHVNRELRHSCRFSTLVSEAYSILTYLYKLAVLIINLYMRALDVHLCGLSLPVPVKYAYFKLCMNYNPFCEFYIFKPSLSQELGVTTKSIERYFVTFEKHGLFERNHKKSKEVGKSGSALYGTLTPPLALIYDNTCWCRQNQKN